MMADKTLKTFVKKLVNLSLKEGSVCGEKVRAVLQSLAQKNPLKHKQILQLYLRYIKRELDRNQALLEYAGALSETTLDNIATKLSTLYNRPISITVRENTALLAGFRLSVADDIYDSSLSTRLEGLNQNN